MNSKWGQCVTDALAEKGLSFRAARIKCEGMIAHTTWKDWADGLVPNDANKAAHALELCFGRQKAMECLLNGGIPIPEDWQTGIDGVIFRLNRYFDEQNTPEHQRKQKIDSVVEIIKHNDSKNVEE